MNNDPLVFDVNIAKEKPNSYRKHSACPFCSVADLSSIYAQKGDMIWLQNKYPTLRDTVQTVLIESADHQGDITTYSRKQNRALLRFSLSCFNKMQSQKAFKSTLWYKNFGPQAGGSLVHPHMQIVGLKKQDGYQYLTEKNFIGFSLFNEKRVEVNISKFPIQGYIEININLLDPAAAALWADWIQTGARYILNVLSNGRCDSYNLFFYPRQNNIICAKLIARFATPPYFVGYKLSQVDNDEKLLDEAQRLANFFENGSYKG